MSKFTLLLTTMPGLGTVARSEVESVSNRAQAKEVLQSRGYDLSVFDFERDVAKLLHLRTVEDVFWLLAEQNLNGQLSDLSRLRKIQLPRILEAANLKKSLKSGKFSIRPSFRIVVQAEDKLWRKYRRVDMERALASTVQNQSPTWRLVDDKAEVEIWAQQVGRRLLISLRLSDSTLRHREYLVSSRPAALRPTVAAALCWLSGPQDDDVFLDPMCGSGTILIERALMGRYKQLVGGDVDRAAVEAAKDNFGRKHQPWRLQQWDAKKMPLKDESVSAVVTNPPWGRQIGEAEQIEGLYANMISEVERVLVSGGRFVIISSQWSLLKKILARHSKLRIEQAIKNISVLGWHADIYVVKKF